MSDNTSIAVPLDWSAANLIALYLTRFDREHTRRAYGNDLYQFFDAQHVDLAMSRRITFVDVNAYLTDLERRGYKSSTINRRVAALRGYFDWLHALGVIDANPAHRQLIRKVRAVRREDSAITVLTRTQSSALLQSVAPDLPSSVRDRALITTLLHCVLRRSEAAAMDFEHIRQIGAHHILDLPATKGAAQQFVKMPTSVVQAIAEVKETYGYEAGPIWRSLSNNSLHNRLTPRSIYSIVHTAAERAGILATVGAHTLRHTGCTLAIESGATPQQVQAHARHKNLETTMIYIHQRDRLRNSAADFIDIDIPPAD
ncbi:MAG: tyrosine-type recombinase/integrase [Bacteroidota bacterium]